MYTCILQVAAASLLARGLACAPLERMLLFSSVSATLGNAGQAAYSGANAALDCAAADLQSQVSPWLLLMQQKTTTGDCVLRQLTGDGV